MMDLLELGHTDYESVNGEQFVNLSLELVLEYYIAH